MCAQDDAGVIPVEGVRLRFVFTAPRYHTNQHFAIKALLDAGHEVSFLALRRGQSEVYEVLHPSILGEAAPVRLWMRTWRQMRALRPDVVVVRDPPTAFGLVSVAAARLMGRTVVFYTHTPVYRRLGWWKKLWRWLPAWATGAAWITPVLGWPDRYPRSPWGACGTVPFVIEPQTTPDRKEWFRGGAINVLCIGKFQELKSHRPFYRGEMSRLSSRYPVQATIVGECSTDGAQAHELAKTQGATRSPLGLGNRVHHQRRIFRTARCRESTPSFTTCSCWPAAKDASFRVSLLEAMAHSLPVICSDSCGTGRSATYVRGENGYVFGRDDVDGLVAAMEADSEGSGEAEGDGAAQLRAGGL